MKSRRPRWRIVIIGDGTQEPQYKWELFDNASNSGLYSSRRSSGHAVTKADCYEQALGRAEEIALADRSDSTKEEHEFDVVLPPALTGGEFDDLPVIEPDRELRMEDSSE